MTDSSCLQTSLRAPAADVPIKRSFLVGSRMAHLGTRLSEQEKNNIVVFLKIGNFLVAKRAWEKSPDNLKYANPTRFVSFR
jgi:hypothetical protein